MSEYASHGSTDYRSDEYYYPEVPPYEKAINPYAPAGSPDHGPGYEPGKEVEVTRGKLGK